MGYVKSVPVQMDTFGQKMRKILFSIALIPMLSLFIRRDKLESILQEKK
jgi:hypothetical protein